MPLNSELLNVFGVFSHNYQNVFGPIEIAFVSYRNMYVKIELSLSLATRKLADRMFENDNFLPTVIFLMHQKKLSSLKAT